MYKLVVLFGLIALASGSGIAPLWGPHLAAPLAAPWAAAGHVAVAAGPVGAYNYRGPLSLGHGQPASILAADGRPLDTLSVNVDKAVHYTAKALEGGHWLGKRSIVAPLAAAPLAWSHAAVAAPVIAPAHIGIAPVARVAPWGLGHGLGHGHLVGKRSIVAPLAAAPLAWSHAAVAAPVIAPAHIGIAPVARVAPWGLGHGLGHGHLVGKRSIVAPLAALGWSHGIAAAPLLAPAHVGIAAAPIAPLGHARLGHW
ncbi:uncharacterized protein LOC116772678 [Danaus plexippus]|uniref:uncharacterized protein LOC116772678 n=1 Tax=Danaus plexippus TaxID=13037 RepID=UPI002AB08E65|nr:uncharacterized protein LOC116772678 [Danaus plexippus]